MGGRKTAAATVALLASSLWFFERFSVRSVCVVGRWLTSPPSCCRDALISIYSTTLFHMGINSELNCRHYFPLIHTVHTIYSTQHQTRAAPPPDEVVVGMYSSSIASAPPPRSR